MCDYVCLIFACCFFFCFLHIIIKCRFRVDEKLSRNALNGGRFKWSLATRKKKYHDEMRREELDLDEVFQCWFFFCGAVVRCE